MALLFSWLQLIQRAKRHINNDFPGADFNISDTEVLLYINDAMSFGLVGQMYNGAKLTGVMEVPEAYLVTFLLPALQQNAVTRNWYSTLPQPPLSLPLGYSITRGYFADNINGQGVDWIWLKAKRVSRRSIMPMQYGVYANVENVKLILSSSDGSSLSGKTAYVQMPSTRAVNITDSINLPDDAVDAIFTKVIMRLKERLQLPQDIIQDDVASGNKSS